jgi:hypothetical protein
MTTLILNEFKCYAETNESGDDSPYFVFFVGDPTSPKSASLIRIRQSHWDNDVAKGDLFKPGASVAPVTSSSFVLCALMEEDDNADFVPENGAFANVRKSMREQFDAYAASGSSAATTLATKLIPKFGDALNEYCTNDDLVAVVHIPMNIDLVAHGSFAFRGDGAHYKAWFRKA